MNQRSDEQHSGPARGLRGTAGVGGKLKRPGGEGFASRGSIHKHFAKRVKGIPNGVCEPKRKGRILNCDQKGRSFKLLSFRLQSGVRRVSVLSEVRVGESGVLVALDLPESVQNHLMHMGFVPGALVTALRRAPAGDPTVYSVDGMEIALRRETAAAIRVKSPLAVIGGDSSAEQSSEFAEAT